MSDNVEESNRKFLDPSPYLDLHPNLMGSIPGQDPSSNQVSLNYVLCNPADRPTNKQATQIKYRENITFLVLVKM